MVRGGGIILGLVKGYYANFGYQNISEALAYLRRLSSIGMRLAEDPLF